MRIILLLILALFVSFLAVSKSSVESNHPPALGPVLKRISARTKPEGKEIKIIFAGDIMLSRGIGAQMAKNDDWKYPFLNIADFLKSTDMTFANLEGPISSRGVNVGSIYSFRADPKSVEGLVYSGIDVVSFANNHVWDYGREAFEDTLLILDENGINHIGAGDTYGTAHTPVVKEINGTKIAFLGYTNLLPPFLGKMDASPAVAFPDKEQMAKDIQTAKSLADIVVVSFHWGDEYKTHHNQLQEDLGHAAIDAGADFVVGHHPHVAEDVEMYNGKYIAYSLGNFVFDQNFSEDTSWGLLLILAIKDKKIIDLKQQKVVFNSTFQPSLGR